MALRCLTKLKFNHQILKSSRVLGIKNSKILLNVNTDFQIDGLEKINLTQVRHRYDKSSKSKQPDLNDQDVRDFVNSIKFHSSNNLIYFQSDDENDFLEDPEKKNIVKYKVPSLRIDLIIKSGLSIARNKIELAFYENKIRKNGQKIAKKSLPVNIGDEIDFIKGRFSNFVKLI